MLRQRRIWMFFHFLPFSETAFFVKFCARFSLHITSPPRPSWAARIRWSCMFGRANFRARSADKLYNVLRIRVLMRPLYTVSQLMQPLHILSPSDSFNCHSKLNILQTLHTYQTKEVCVCITVHTYVLIYAYTIDHRCKVRAKYFPWSTKHILFLEPSCITICISLLMTITIQTSLFHINYNVRIITS